MVVVKVKQRTILRPFVMRSGNLMIFLFISSCTINTVKWVHAVSNCYEERVDCPVDCKNKCKEKFKIRQKFGTIMDTIYDEEPDNRYYCACKFTDKLNKPKYQVACRDRSYSGGKDEGASTKTTKTTTTTIFATTKPTTTTIFTTTRRRTTTTSTSTTTTSQPITTQPRTVQRVVTEPVTTEVRTQRVINAAAVTTQPRVVRTQASAGSTDDSVVQAGVDENVAAERAAAASSGSAGVQSQPQSGAVPVEVYDEQPDYPDNSGSARQQSEAEESTAGELDTLTIVAICMVVAPVVIIAVVMGFRSLYERKNGEDGVGFSDTRPVAKQKISPGTTGLPGDRFRQQRSSSFSDGESTMQEGIRLQRLSNNAEMWRGGYSSDTSGLQKFEKRHSRKGVNNGLSTGDDADSVATRSTRASFSTGDGRETFRSASIESSRSSRTASASNAERNLDLLRANWRRNVYYRSQGT